MKLDSNLNNDLIFHNEVSAIDAFKQEYPKLSKIVELAIESGLEVEYNLDDVKLVISWYNNNLQTHIRMEMEFNSTNILDHPFMVEFKNGDLNTITLCDYINSVIGEIPIEVACCSAFIFRTSGAEYTIDKDFRISKWRFHISGLLLSNGQKYTDVLKDILVDTNTRNELINNYNASDSDLIELYRLLHQLTHSAKTDWQILKTLEQSDLFNRICYESLINFLVDKGNKEYMEIIEILQ